MSFGPTQRRSCYLFTHTRQYHRHFTSDMPEVDEVQKFKQRAWSLVKVHEYEVNHHGALTGPGTDPGTLEPITIPTNYIVRQEVRVLVARPTPPTFCLPPKFQVGDRPNSVLCLVLCVCCALLSVGLSICYYLKYLKQQLTAVRHSIHYLLF